MSKLVKRFTSIHCAPCRMLAPVLQQIETELPDVKFEVIDIDEHPEQATQYKIRNVPTVLIIKDDQVMDTIVGANPKKRYMDALATL